MVLLKPLTGLRPRPKVAAAVAAVPYDVVDREQARALAEPNPDSFLRISRSEIELPDSVDPYDLKVYDHAAANLEAFIARGTLVRDTAAALYLYRLRSGSHEQTGVMGGFSVEDYDAGRIKIHEKTRPDKENDRVRHILRLRAHTEPVLLGYRDDGSLRAEIAEQTSFPPLCECTAPDRVQHLIWKVSNPEVFISAFSEMPHVYIADGHHRAASASRVAKTLREDTEKTEHQFFLAVAFPHSELKILPYNRIIKHLPFDTATLLSRLEEFFHVKPDGSAEPSRKGEFSMFLDGRWYLLKPKAAVETTDPLARDPLAQLDISLLTERVLNPILQITDQRTDKNIDFVGGVHGVSRLEELVRSGRAACAFSLYPVSIDELFAVSDRDMLMPPKSTWFEPKLRSGLFIHTF